MGMKTNMMTEEQIFQKIDQLKKDNDINQDRKEHFKYHNIDTDKVEMYEKMIEKNEIRIDILYEILGIEYTEN